MSTLGVRSFAGVSERLLSRRAEIEQAALERVRVIADPVEVADPEYAEGLRLALSAALDYGLASLTASEELAPTIPETLLAQARLAARSGVSLDTVLRRYFAGYTLFGDFLVHEAEAEHDEELKGAELKRLLQTQATLFDQLIASVSEAFEQERVRRHRSPAQRRAERVRRLLDGERLDTAELAYEVDAWHVGIVLVGGNSAHTLRRLAQALDCTLLLVTPGEETSWAWLGGRRAIPTAGIVERLGEELPEPALAAIGEPGEGLAGWRLTHRQATAALAVARRGAEPVVRYGEVGLLASVIQDDLLVDSLRQLYLQPLERERDGGEALRETLGAYFGAERNVSSAAAALGVSRQTVIRRLQTVEQLIGDSLGKCAVELELALGIGPRHGP